MEFTTSKGRKYYLHSKEIIFGRNHIKHTNYFFKKEKGEGLCSLPVGYKVIETRGMPMLKKI